MGYLRAEVESEGLRRSLREGEPDKAIGVEGQGADVPRELSGADSPMVPRGAKGKSSEGEGFRATD